MGVVSILQNHKTAEEMQNCPICNGWRGMAAAKNRRFQFCTKTDNYLTKTGQKNLGDHALATAFGGPACLPVLVFDIRRVDRSFFPGCLLVEHGDKIDGIFSIVGVQ